MVQTTREPALLQQRRTQQRTHSGPQLVVTQHTISQKDGSWQRQLLIVNGVKRSPKPIIAGIEAIKSVWTRSRHAAEMQSVLLSN